MELLELKKKKEEEQVRNKFEYDIEIKFFLKFIFTEIIRREAKKG